MDGKYFCRNEHEIIRELADLHETGAIRSLQSEVRESRPDDWDLIASQENSEHVFFAVAARVENLRYAWTIQFMNVQHARQFKSWLLKK